jgi:hypothetical protein
MEKTLSENIIDLLIHPNFRWIVYFLVIILTIIAFIQEPIRFSKKKSTIGITWQYHYFMIFCFTIFAYLFTFLSLWYTIYFTDKLPYLWYIPFFVLIYATLLQITVNTTHVSKDDTLNSPPDTFLPRKYRYLIYILIVICDIIIFIQAFIYSGITTEFKTTVLHQIFLNRFGGFSSKNLFNFLTGWFGLIGLGLDFYMIYNQVNFKACQYGLPESWNF